MRLFFKTKYDDPTIVRMIGQGGQAEEKAMLWLNAQFEDKIDLACRKHQLAREDAEEAYDDALIALRDNIRSGKFKGESALRTYFGTIFFNKCIDRIRKAPTKWETPEPEPVEDKDHLVLMEQQRQMEANGQLRRTCLGEAIAVLSAKEQALAVDAFVEGMKPRDLAVKYGYHTNKVAAQTIFVIKNKLLESIENLCKTKPQCHLLCQPGKRITLL